jgi:glycine cleavage system regulatory protein
MANSLVLTICAHDRPGVMKLISNTIAECEGNWLESRMARLGGQFAGIVRVECSEGKLPQLTENLNSLSDQGISVQIHDQGDLSDYPYTRCLRLDIFGNDRPGIVSQLTEAISSAGANIEELNTSIESAAMQEPYASLIAPMNRNLLRQLKISVMTSTLKLAALPSVRLLSFGSGHLTVFGIRHIT